MWLKPMQPSSHKIDFVSNNIMMKIKIQNSINICKNICLWIWTISNIHGHFPLTILNAEDAVAIWDIIQYKSYTQFSKNCLHVTYCSVVKSFMSRVWQNHCHALCKFSKWFHNWNRCSGWTSFHEIWVRDEFSTDIPYCNSPLYLSCISTTIIP